MFFLQSGKTLLVPTPRHRPGLLTKFALPENSDDETLLKCASRQVFCTLTAFFSSASMYHLIIFSVAL